MGLKTEETTIDGIRYRVTQLPTKQGRALLVRLFKLAGPAFGEALGGVNVTNIKLADMRVSALGSAMTELATRLNEADLDFVFDQLANSAHVNVGGSEWPKLSSVADLHFAGEYAAMFKFIGWALEVNFLGFLKGQGGIAGFLALQKAKMQSPSPKPSTGFSGESSQVNESVAA